MKMKMMNKKILTGTLAASVLLGSGLTGALYNKAFAATDGTSSSAAVTTAADTAAPGDGQGHHGQRGQRGGGHDGFRVLNVEKETASILGIDETTLRDQQKQGQTLVQIAQDKGVTEDVLLQELTTAATDTINAAVTAGSLTQTQADQQTSGLADRLKQQVEGQGFGHNEGQGHGKMERGRFGTFADPEAMAQILGMTQAELNTELQAGKSLAEVAEAKGIAKDELIAKIKDSLTDKLTNFIDKKETKDKAAATNSSDTSAN
ncbi:hypothetical protein [Paenibacillus cremeus]|uniref:Uncharacterized protein n=1 Tax=Paenibacillus cremeus TaxID=2163881 RepID=A0A559KB83_9BACL|nr:hypothetical protein [Paenibacillus cremeus]TVY09394.1 hypothetical protein FPZ49_13130 [Paenibacillus cremeus]